MIATQNLERYFTQALLLRAWEAVASKASAPGIDEISVTTFARQSDQRLLHLHKELNSGRYAPKPALVFPKRKEDSDDTRLLAILTVRDRIAARAAAQLLVNHHDEGLQPQSYAYRPRRGALKAVGVVERHLKDSSHAVRIDIAQFFDSIDYDILADTLRRCGEPDAVVDILMRCARIKRFDGVEVQATERGIPQGSPLAPVLSNLYLDQLDRELNNHHLRFVRYADDLIILTRDADEASRAFRIAQDSLHALHLEPSVAKSRVSSVDEGFLFLGFLFNRNGKAPCREARDRLSRKMREAYDDEDDEQQATRRNAILRGWTNYFGEKVDDKCQEPPADAKQADEPRVVSDAKGVISERLQSEHFPSAPTESTTAPGSAADYSEDAQPTPDRDPQECSEGMDALSEARNLSVSGRLVQASQVVRRFLADEEIEIATPQGRRAVELLADIYERQGLRGAAAKCRRSAGIEPKQTDARADKEPPFGAKDVEKWLEIFGKSDQPVYRQFIDRLGRHGYRPASHCLNAEYLRDHWRGRHTVAAPVFADKEKVPFGVLDLDITRSTLDTLKAEQIEQKREEILRDAVHLVDIAHRAGVEGVLEDSGYKGYHVWFFFFAPLNAAHVRRFLTELIRVAGPPPDGTHRELFPGSDSPKSDSVGMRIKIPMGLHRLSGRKSAFLTPHGKPCDLHEQMSRLTVRTNGRALYQAVAHWQNVAAQFSQQEVPPSKQNGEEPPSRSRVETVYERCAVLRALRKKAAERHDLTHYERSVVRGILGPLGEEGRREIHNIIRHCANYSASTTNGMLDETKAHRPMGCRRIREILDSMCADLPCHCRFKPKKNDYAHPLRHLEKNGRSTSKNGRIPSGGASEGVTGSGNKTQPPPPPGNQEKPDQDDESDDILATVARYREKRGELLTLQRKLVDALGDNPSRALSIGELKPEGPDPQIKRWIIEL